MKKEFEAYYSKKWALIFMFCSILILVGIILFSIFGVPDVSLIFIITLSIVSVMLIYMFVITVRKNGIAVEVVDDKLILHKKKLIEVPFHDIMEISIHDGDGSFDILIKTKVKNYGMHCFIKKQRKKKAQLISLLKNKGIKVETYDLI